MLIVVTCHICSPTDSFKPQLMFHCCSVTQSCPTFCHPMDGSLPGFPFLHHPPSPRVCSDSCPLSWWCHLILDHSLLFPPSIFPIIRVFSHESVLHIKWPKFWTFSFSISPSNDYSRLISFRMDWLDCLAVQGTVKSSPTPQFKSINSLTLSFLYSPTLTSIHDYWKNHSLD